MAAKKQIVITFVTSNANKLAEVQRALSIGPSQPFSLIRGDVDLPELQGEPKDVAIQKCKVAAAKVNGPVLVEDTSLCYRALGELPGVYVKWFLEKTGRKGLVNLLAAYDDKTAFAQCIFALSAGPDHTVHVFVGRTQGKIVDERGGPDSFGWDPVFEPDEGSGKTFAEMTKDEKNAISHRGKALRQACEFLSGWDPEQEVLESHKKVKINS